MTHNEYDQLIEHIALALDEVRGAESHEAAVWESHEAAMCADRLTEALMWAERAKWVGGGDDQR